MCRVLGGVAETAAESAFPYIPQMLRIDDDRSINLSTRYLLLGSILAETGNLTIFEQFFESAVKVLDVVFVFGFHQDRS